MKEEYIHVENGYLEARVKLENTEQLLSFVKIPRWRALAAIMNSPKRQAMPWDYPGQPFEIRLPSGALHMLHEQGGEVTDLRTGRIYPYTAMY
jgi:hypothetical protein